MAEYFTAVTIQCQFLESLGYITLIRNGKKSKTNVALECTREHNKILIKLIKYYSLGLLQNKVIYKD